MQLAINFDDVFGIEAMRGHKMSGPCNFFKGWQPHYVRKPNYVFGRFQSYTEHKHKKKEKKHGCGRTDKKILESYKLYLFMKCNLAQVEEALIISV